MNSYDKNAFADDGERKKKGEIAVLFVVYFGSSSAVYFRLG